MLAVENTGASIPERQEEEGWAVVKQGNLQSSLKRQKTTYSEKGR